MIRNCPINPEYSVKADHIYGPNIPFIQEGMKQRINISKSLPRVTLLTDILLHHKNIEPYFDFFNMNGIPFLHTKSYKINLLTAEIFTSNSVDNTIK